MIRRFLAIVALIAFPAAANADGLMKTIIGSSISGGIQGGIVADELNRAQAAAAGNQILIEVPRWRERIKSISRIYPLHVAPPSSGIESFGMLVDSRNTRWDGHQKKNVKLVPDELEVVSVLMVPNGSGRSYVLIVTPKENLRPETELSNPGP